MNVENFTKISFPIFGLEMNPPKGFSLFGLDIRFYGIIIALGLILAVVYGLKRKAQFGLSEDDILDGVLGVVPFAIICARAYYCAFSWEQFADNPIRVLYIWEGGIAIYGGVIGAFIGIVVFCLIKKVKLGAVLDLVALGFLIGQCIGRWGNFFNREAFGAETDTFLKMGLYDSVKEVTTYYHPTFLYESLWNAVGFLALHFLSKKRQYDGQIALGYAAWYGLGRTFIEGLRMDSLYWGQFRVSQLLAAITCFAAATALVVLAFRKHDKNKLFVNVVAAKQAAIAEQNEEQNNEDSNEEAAD
ncbi:MAG: prolipoprotein diacylglyceryl transferase [Oscillospiraceae bacterium]|nr:prolipoprotein diacylglyceryl transferase [Oscillospiraceae bacterium]